MTPNQGYSIKILLSLSCCPKVHTRRNRIIPFLLFFLDIILVLKLHDQSELNELTDRKQHRLQCPGVHFDHHDSLAIEAQVAIHHVVDKIPSTSEFKQSSTSFRQGERKRQMTQLLNLSQHNTVYGGRRDERKRHEPSLPPVLPPRLPLPS